MKVQTFDGTRERRVVTALVTCPEVLARVANVWEGEMLPSRWANLVGSWCVDYYRRYRKAPGRAVEILFASWAEETNADKATVELIASFLAGLSEEYEREDPPNPGHLLDVTAALFNHNRLARLAALIQGDLDTGRASRAEEHVAKYRRVELGVGSRVDLFSDMAAVASTFEHADSPCVAYPGALGRFFDGLLTLDEGFVAFMGPEKSGKTWFLLDVAWRAMCQRRKVAFFEVGDMSERQIKRRFLSRAAHCPSRSPNNVWPYTVDYPVRLGPPAEGTFLPAVVEHEQRMFEAPLDEEKAKEACRKVTERHLRSGRSFFSLSTHPNSSVNVAGINAALTQWSLAEGWEPDVIVIDYADILATEPGTQQFTARDRVNENWKAIRRLAAERHCLVVTATQADSASYEKTTLDRRNFSEDHRKLAHCTGVVGINVTTQEKAKRLCRLNLIVVREQDFLSVRCVHVAQCLPVANPCVLSTF